jgi:hypothetical protein
VGGCILSKNREIEGGNMAKENHFVDDFYCKKCGSMTALKIGNSEYIRCVGCLALYFKGEKWEEFNHSTVHPNENIPPPGQDQPI